MVTTLIQIGNSVGIRIPKPLLQESGLVGDVELKVKKGEIRIVKASKKNILNETALLSENALGDWLKPEEDIAWQSLQKEK